LSEHPIDDVHRLLDAMDEIIRDIDSIGTTTIQVSDVPSLSMVILEILGWTNTAYMENHLGLEPSLLSKFVKMRGSAPKHIVRKTADRVRSYLRSQDQITAPTRNSEIQASTPNTITVTSVRQFRGEVWVPVPHRSQMQQKIGAISTILNSIIEQVNFANRPEAEQALTAIEKAQLVAVLETALAVLRAPLVEKALLKKTADILGEGAKRTVEKSVQDNLGVLMSMAQKRLVEFILSVFT